MPKEEQYWELAKDCYFVDTADCIVQVSKKGPPVKYKLGPMATFVTKFLVQKVKKDTMIDIVNDHFGKGIGDKIVGEVINSLKLEKLITKASAPKLPRPPMKGTEVVLDTEKVAVTVSWPVAPSIPTIKGDWFMIPVAPSIPTIKSEWLLRPVAPSIPTIKGERTRKVIKSKKAR